MSRTLLVAIIGLSLAHTAAASEIVGHYMEARTCQVYTGPCFANGEVGVTGKDAVMAWSIQSGRHNDIDLKGLSVAIMVRSSDTLGFQGLEDGNSLQSVIVVDKKADDLQRTALIDFAKTHAGKAGRSVKSVCTAPIKMELNTVELTGKLKADKFIQLSARQARKGDCICSNESAYYPPLAKLEGFVPGVALTANVSAPGLGRRWSMPDSRTAYLGTFIYE